jgi:hypothetical protein
LRLLLLVLLLPEVPVPQALQGRKITPNQAQRRFRKQRSQRGSQNCSAFFEQSHELIVSFASVCVCICFLCGNFIIKYVRFFNLYAAVNALVSFKELFNPNELVYGTNK